MASLNEETVFVPLDLPDDLGRDWEWYADLNIVALRRGLDVEGRMRAVEDLIATWKREHLRIVESA